MWLRKLSTCDQSLDEMKLRNDFMYYLVLNIQNGELRPPFTEPPPPTALIEIVHLLPGGAEATMAPCGNTTCSMSNFTKPNMDATCPEPCNTTQQFVIFKNSPDGGAFLATQPVPRCGVFCYLAVVSKGSDAQE